MDFLGIGVPEVVVIIILALIFIGPRDLPRIAARAGKFLRDIRMMSEGFTTEWRREMAALSQVEELKELKEELTSTREALQEAGQEIQGTMRIEAEDLEPDSPQPPETRPATTTTGNASDGDSDIQDEEAEAETTASTSIPETSDQKTQNVMEDEETEPETSTSPQSQTPSSADEKVEDEDDENEEDLEARTIHPPHPVASVSPTDAETNQSSDHQGNAPSKHNGHTTDEVEIKPPKSATTEESSGSE